MQEFYFEEFPCPVTPMSIPRMAKQGRGWPAEEEAAAAVAGVAAKAEAEG